MKLAAVLFALLLQVAPRGSIEGVVVRAGSEQPVAGAQVTLTRAGAARGTSIRPVDTAADGRFRFDNLEVGSYTLTVLGNGYARHVLGQHYSGGPGSPIALADGEASRGHSIRLISTGNIEGYLRNSRGRPLPGITVQLVRQVFVETGQRMFNSVATARTDDRGQYRFYWVSPGRYYVLAGVPSMGIDASQSQNGNEVVDNYPYTFFPGTTDFEKALAVDVQPGGEHGGIDFALVETRTYRIHARIVDPATGERPRTAMAAISYWSPGGGGSRAGGDSYNAETGIMQFARVLPGSYTVSISAYEGPGIPTRAFTRTTSGMSAGATVVVSNSDVDLGVLRLEPPNVITGRLTGDPLPPATTTNSVQVTFLTDDPAVSQSFSRIQQRPQADGSFTAYYPYSSLRVVVTGLPPGFYVREARLDGSDASTQTARVSRANDLQIVLSSKAGELNGIVRDASLKPVAAARIALIPEDARDRFEFFKEVVSGPGGSFIISGIAPGNYKVFAWEALEPYGYFDPEVLRRSAGKGMDLRIDESARRTLELSVIPAGLE